MEYKQILDGRKMRPYHVLEEIIFNSMKLLFAEYRRCSRYEDPVSKEQAWDLCHKFREKFISFVKEKQMVNLGYCDVTVFLKKKAIKLEVFWSLKGIRSELLNVQLVCNDSGNGRFSKYEKGFILIYCPDGRDRPDDKENTIIDISTPIEFEKYKSIYGSYYTTLVSMYFKLCSMKSQLKEPVFKQKIDEFWKYVNILNSLEEVVGIKVNRDNFLEYSWVPVDERIIHVNHIRSAFKIVKENPKAEALLLYGRNFGDYKYVIIKRNRLLARSFKKNPQLSDLEKRLIIGFQNFSKKELENLMSTLLVGDDSGNIISVPSIEDFFQLI